METLTAAPTAIGPLLATVAHYLNAPGAPTLTTFGVASGKGGTILFNCHYAAFSGETGYYERALAELEQVMAALNPRTYKADFSSNYYQELAELGGLLVYLTTQGHLDWDAEPTLQQIDNLLADRMRHYLASHNFERTSGALSCGTYFLRRLPHTERARPLLEELLAALTEQHQGDEQTGYYWLCRVIAEPRAYTGFSHGSAMIMTFLADLHAAGIRPAQCATLLRHATTWLLAARIDPDRFLSSFPLWAGKAELTNNLCLIYGDLGTAYGLLRAAAVLQDEAAREAALAVVMRTLPRRNLSETHIQDASVYYGAAGVYLLYDALYRHTAVPEFATAATYWLERIPSLATHPNDYLHFSPQFYAHYPAAQLGMSFGVVGIGLTLLQAESEGRYALAAFVGLS
ncbi:lanthionine synthetase LanC family protein [Hymenobacter siberiensis]|jgi:lantibiotic modifying enzyme|uniref:lanthionine synthetase LanC family protein n=1 Tax=Hymenobacter siberiensis TaxID=2848396 RepID=UPI001C1DFEBC|nr:lanthionine synthetase LanC family protein [Hymenobacter siberiensis]MBU6120256.1 hypothetical protein [Hymenobacter siberiensis]